MQNYCIKDHIEGVQKVGTNYLISADAVKLRYVYVYEKDAGSKGKTKD